MRIVRVAIAAPTGKAATRLAEALAAQMKQLAPAGRFEGFAPAGAQDPPPASAGTALGLPATGMTVHRLLGLRGEDSPQRAEVPGYDLVIVDEASMLDLEIARLLVDSIPAHGRLVLAGDRDQLASVEAGAVFMSSAWKRHASSSLRTLSRSIWSSGE